jgi:NADPH2:quinone reductase
MKALQTHGVESLDRLQLDELPTPEPAAGQIRVRVQASAIGFVDLLLARGGYQIRPALPFSPGSEYAGVVEAIGPGTTTELRPGDAVAGLMFVGAWREQVCVDVRTVQRLPSGTAPEQGALIAAPYATSLYALDQRGHLAPGESVLVLGAAGGVGWAAVQLAKAIGARVIAAASTPAKRQAVREAGADEVIDLGDADWKDQVKRLTGGRGVDVVVDPVGGAATETAFRTLAWGGRHLVIGFAAGSIPKLPANLALLKGAALVGVDVRQFGERQPDAAAANLRRVFALYAEGRLQPRIAQALPVAQYREAIALAQAHDTVGRVVLRF